jgi:hypothetical protein
LTLRPIPLGRYPNGRVVPVSRLLSCSPSQPPSWAWFEPAGGWGTTMPLTRDSPSTQGDVPGPDPARAPLPRRSPRWGSPVGAAGGGLPCLGKVRHAERRCPASGRAWSTVGPHAIGAERFVAVSSGLQPYIVRPGRRCHPGEVAQRSIDLAVLSCRPRPGVPGSTGRRRQPCWPAAPPYRTLDRPFRTDCCRSAARGGRSGGGRRRGGPVTWGWS